MGKGTRYNNEFKQEAVNQVVVHGYSVADVSQHLGISNKSLYDWIKVFRPLALQCGLILAVTITGYVTLCRDESLRTST